MPTATYRHTARPRIDDRRRVRGRARSGHLWEAEQLALMLVQDPQTWRSGMPSCASSHISGVAERERVGVSRACKRTARASGEGDA
jgi:hypothetical protein